jgi:hypothetical protein
MKLNIIIPFYLGELYYERLIKSLAKAIKKVEAKTILFEVITIIDSVGTDESLIFDFNTNIFINNDNIIHKIIKNEINMGVAASRNLAIANSTGEFLHLIDQDDEVTENFYEQVVSRLEDYTIVLSNGIVHYNDTKFNSHKLYYFMPQFTVKGILKDDYIRSPGQVVFSRLLLGNELFPEGKKYKGTDDRYFWIKLFLSNVNIKPYYNPNPNYIAHIHGQNFSDDLINMKKSELENWLSFNVSSVPLDLRKLIRNDILRIRFSLNEKLSKVEKITALKTYFSYFFKFNKIVRFIIKRTKW